MHLEQFFVRPEDVAEGFLTLKDDEAWHILKSKRKQIGNDIRAVDGQGNGYHGVIHALYKDRIVVAITHRDWRQNEPEIQLTLALGLIKGDRFDWVVEKGTEIGVSRFIPVLSDFTVAVSARLPRWRNVAIAAMKQSGRSVLPEILAPMPFSDLIALPFDRKLLVHPLPTGENASAWLEKARPRTVLLVVGPEGGFSDSELARAKGEFATLALGQRRLRSETAAVVASTLVLASLNEMDSTISA